jgi:hypothetical protein
VQAGEPQAAVLILHKDAAGVADRVAGIKLSNSSVQDQRQAICRLRREDFAKREAAARARLLESVPPSLTDEIHLQALPLLNAWLVFFPTATAGQVVPALHDRVERNGGSLYRLGDVDDESLVPATIGSTDLCVGEKSIAQSGAKGLVLGIIDTPPDITHPTLSAGLGRIFLQGDASTRRQVEDRHGTAMLGIYAQAAAGKHLSSQGHALAASVSSPVPLKATLVAQAGQETPQGQARFAHALHWLLAAEGRPFPDLLNYSRGNGALCVEETDAGCAEEGGTGITRLLDRAIDDYALIAVKSAGNRHWARTHTMTAPGATWNGMTVGNMHPFDWQRCGPGGARRHHKLYRTSSVGAEEPRLMDLVAPGVRIDTAAPGVGQMLSTGTSPAAAVVGVAALRLMAAGVRDPLRVKAVLINAADSWDSRGAASPAARGHNAPCGADANAPRHGPHAEGSLHDRSYGWGYLNEKRALREAHHARAATITRGERVCFAVHAEPYDKFTLAWMRTPESSALTLTLTEAGEPRTLIDEDTASEENLLQVSNGRGKASAARAGGRLLIVASPLPEAGRLGKAQGTQRFAVASPHALTPLEKCSGMRESTP